MTVAWREISIAGLILLAGLGYLLRTGALRQPSSPVTDYKVHGVLRVFDARLGEATISEEAIPGYMEAMTMTYRVSDSGKFALLHPGDSLLYHLMVTARDVWVERAEKIVNTSTLPFDPAPQIGPRHELSLGDPVPDLELLDTQGRKIHLSDFRGSALALTFIYTRCPLPTYCPLITRLFREAQALMDRMEAGNNWHFLLITLDPEHDTPALLANLAQNEDVDLQHWSYASGSSEAIQRFGASVGLEFSVSSQGLISHNLRTVIVDPTGHLSHVFKGNSWTSQDLAAEVRSAMETR